MMNFKIRDTQGNGGIIVNSYSELLVVTLGLGIILWFSFVTIISVGSVCLLFWLYKSLESRGEEVDVVLTRYFKSLVVASGLGIILSVGSTCALFWLYKRLL